MLPWLRGRLASSKRYQQAVHFLGKLIFGDFTLEKPGANVLNIALRWF